MEERQSLKAALMESSEEVDLFISSKECGVVPDGGEERVEASVGKGDQSERALYQSVFLSLHFRRLHSLLSLLFNLLQLRHATLQVARLCGIGLKFQIFAEGSVQFSVVMDQGLLQVLPAGLQAGDDVGEFFFFSFFEEGFGVAGAIGRLEAVD